MKLDLVKIERLQLACLVNVLLKYHFFFSTGVSLSVTVYTWNNVWDMEVTKDTDHSIGYSSKYAESGMLGGQMWALNLMGLCVEI